MLVYLDTAQLSAVYEMYKRESTRFPIFLEFWLTHGCTLVISRAHLHEIGQSDRDEDVAQKLDLLRYFPLVSTPITANVDSVLITELGCQTLGRLKAWESATWYDPARSQIYDTPDVSAIADAVMAWRPALLEEFTLRKEMAAFQNFDLVLTDIATKLLKKRPKWTPESWRAMARVMAIAPAHSGDPVADRWLAEVKGRYADCCRKARSERQALVCAYELEGLSELDRVPLQDLSRLGFLRALGRHWILHHDNLAEFEEEAVRAALDSFDPYHAPAISVSLAVERGRKRHRQSYKASDHMDVDHVLWAAYSDLAFIDRRTHGYLLQARKNKKETALLSPHIPTEYVRAAAGLEEVKRIIASTASKQASGGWQI